MNNWKSSKTNRYVFFTTSLQLVLLREKLSNYKLPSVFYIDYCYKTTQYILKCNTPMLDNITYLVVLYFHDHDGSHLSACS